MSSRSRVVYFERWPHPVALEMFAQRPQYDAHRLELSAPRELVWAAFETAHIYQIRASRSELPAEFFGQRELLKRAPSLLAISSSGSGSDTIDLDHCTEAGVLVVNQAGGNKEAVAEHALGMMLALAKRMLEADRFMRRETGINREHYMGHDIIGKTLGIIGLGNVGRRLSELARGLFAMQVLAYDPFIEANEFQANGAQSVSLDALLAQSDFVSVHCPRNASSVGMLDARALALMPAHAYFINTARGGIHDEQALAQALSTGAIAGAGLDVWEHEPPPPEHPLLAFDNVIATPHTAGVTHESRHNIVRGAVEQIDTILSGGRAPRILNPQAWDHYVQRFERITGRPIQS